VAEQLAFASVSFPSVSTGSVWISVPEAALVQWGPCFGATVYASPCILVLLLFWISMSGITPVYCPLGEILINL